MFRPRSTRPPAVLAAAALALALTTASTPALACACGCGIFDIGDGTVMPVASDTGFSVWLRYAYMNQARLREHGHAADPADNGDKRIGTSFVTLGGEYMINRGWTVMAELPLVDRRFTTTDDGTWAAPAGTIDTRHLTAPGDAMVKLTYSGFSDDMSTGVSLGVKLPTGRSTSPVGPLGGAGFDRDTLPGSGSTDLALGAYHAGRVSGRLGWYAQGQYQFAVATRDGYRPGNEADAAVGLSWDLGSNARGMGLSPSLGLLASLRAHDSGVNSDPDNTGYARLLLAPGVKLRLGRKLNLYADVELPLAQYVRSADSASGTAGQLTAPVQFKLQVNYGF